MRVIRGKRGDAVTGTIERAFEVILPFLAFLAILYAVVSVGADRKVQTYFQTVEFANIIDAAASFNGQLRLTYTPIENDFLFAAERDSFTVYAEGSKAVTQKPIHLPSRIFFEDKLNISSAKKVDKVQFLKSSDALGVGVISKSLSGGSIYRKDQQICPTSDAKQANSVAFSESQTLASISASTPKITGQRKVYLDLNNLNYLDEGIEKDIKAKLKDLPLVDSISDAQLVVSVTAKASTSASVLVFPDSDPQVQQFACALTSQLASRDISRIGATVVPTLIDVAYNPYISYVSAIKTPRKPTLNLDLVYVAAVNDPELHPIVPYTALLSTAIKSAYAQVYTEGVQ